MHLVYCVVVCSIVIFVMQLVSILMHSFPLHRVKEACILLNLLPGSAVLLRDLLKSSASTNSEGEGVSSSHAALQDAGVYRLTPDDALKVLNLRVHLPNI